MKTKKIWNVGKEGSSPEVAACISEISASLGVTSACARLLYLRGYKSASSARDFIDKNGLGIYDPYKMADMKEAVERIIKAINEKEKIAIYGDYDVDGVSATAVLFLYLEEIAPELQLGYYIPDRFAEGYGMSTEAIDQLAENGVDLIVTVDTGITAVKEVEYARALGIDVVITDHHECHEELPRACAVVNPHRKDSEYPFRELAGVGVAFKLITAIEMMISDGDVAAAIKRVYDKYADLVTLGTIADVMPMVDENRNIIHYGLMKIRSAPRLGVKALIEKAGSTSGKCTTTTISFGIAPRINAAGRMLHASHALELLLLGENDDAEAAEQLAEALCDYNKSRQDEEQRILEDVYKKVEATHDFENDRVIVVADDSWHQGVIGIVASKVVERYGLPTILITFNDEDNNGGELDMGKGSGRSVCGVNLVEALSSASEYLAKFGGHELAAGLSLTRADLDCFKKAINDYVRSIENEDMWAISVNADCELLAEEINMRCAEDIRLLEPFGASNPTPLFYMGEVSVIKSYPIGGGKHIKFVLEKGGNSFYAVMFGASYEVFNYEVGDKLDIMFNLDINEYNGYKSVQLIIREIRRAESIAAQIEREMQRYKEIKDGACFSADEKIIPCREEFVSVYKALKFGGERGVISENRLLTLAGTGINRIKLGFILDILEEMGLCCAKRTTDELVEYRMNRVAEKVDIESSALLARLKAQQK